MQGEFPTRLIVLFGDFARGLDHVGRQAGEFGLVGDDLGEGVGRIEQVFGELRGQRGEFLLDGLEARLPVFRQLGARQAEIAHLVVDDPAPGEGKRRIVGALEDGPVLGEELQVLAEFGVEAAHLWQHLVVRLAPVGNVIDRMQVADDAPGARQALDAVGERFGEVVPGGGLRIVGQAFDQRPAVGEQLGDSRLDVRRNDGVEAGQAGEIEQGVGVGHGISSNENGRPRPPGKRESATRQSTSFRPVSCS